MRTFFISSTFRDMQKERDEMHRRLVPELSKEAFENGDTIAIRDLRWGVNTSDEESEEDANRKVLSVCLDEIDECRPYMIILLGNRYGFCPGEETIKQTVEERNKRAQMEADAENFALENNDISITEMEIRYGAFWKSSESAPQKVLVYIRNIEPCEGIPQEFLRENDESWSKQKNLIDEIRKQAKASEGKIICRDYKMIWDENEQKLCGAEKFVNELMIPDVKKLLEDEWKNAKLQTPLEGELQKHNEYAATKRKNYFVRKKIVSEVCERLGFGAEEKGTGSNLLVLQGESGCGKTALMSYLSEHLKNIEHDTHVDVLLLFCGYTSSVCRAQDIEKIIVEYLEKILKMESAVHEEKVENHKALHDYMEELIENFQKEAHDKGHRLMIMLDAIDQLDADEMRDHLTFLPSNLSEDVQVVLSCTSDFELPFGNMENVLGVKPLSGEPGSSEKNEILQNMFRSHGKEWDLEVLNEIEKKQDSDNPLYLSLIVQRLVMMDETDFRKIDEFGDYNHGSERYQTKIVCEECPEGTSEMCVSILDCAIKGITKNAPHCEKREELFRKVIQYIAVSRFGLRDTDLEQLIDSPEMWSTLDFARLFWYMRQLFIIREDGRYDFSHKGIRESYKKSYLQKQQEECADEKQMHGEILNHLKNDLEETDPIRINEIVYHCRQADDKETFVEYICGYDKTKGSDIYAVAAREVRRMCLEDGRNNSSDLTKIWLYQVLDLCNPWLTEDTPRPCKFRFGADETERLLCFLYYCLEPAFGESDEELKLRKCLLEKGHQLAKELYDKKRDGNADLVICACTKLGEVCQLQGGLWNYNASLRLYTEAREWGEDNENISHRRDGLIHQGDVYAAMSGRENRNRALGLYMDAWELDEDILLQRKITDLLMEGSWDCQKRGLLKLQETYAKDTCQIPDLLRYGDAVLLYSPQEKSALEAFSEAEKMASQKYRDMPDEKNLYIRTLIRERVLFAEGLQLLSSDCEKCNSVLSGYEKIYKDFDGLAEEKKSLRVRKTRAICLEHEGYLRLHFARTLENTAPEDNLKIARERLQDAMGILDEDCWKQEAIDVRRDRMVLCSNLGELCALEEKGNQKNCEETPASYYDEADKLAVKLKKELATPFAYADALNMRLRKGELMNSCQSEDKQRSFYLDCLEDALSLVYETGAPSDMLMVSDIYEHLADLEQTGEVREAYLKRAKSMKEKAEQISTETGILWLGIRNRYLYLRSSMQGI